MLKKKIQIQECEMMSEGEVRIERLNNGVKVIEQIGSRLKGFTIVAGIPAGECFDPLGKAGLGHLGEHVFSGKEGGGIYRYGAELVRRRLVGNAANGEDLTWFYISGGSPTKVPEALDLLSTSLKSPPSEAELKIHKRIVRSELLNYSGDHDRKITWGLGSLFSRCEDDFLAANLNDLSSIRLEDILGFQETYIRGQSLYIAMTGNVPNGFMGMVEERLGTLPANGSCLPEYVKPIICTPFLRYFAFGSEPGVADIALCYDLPVARDPMQEAKLRVLAAAIGGSDSGLLVQQLRGEAGVAYNPIATFDRDSVTGDRIAIKFFCSTDDIGIAMSGLVGVMQRIKQEKLSGEALHLARLEAKSDLRHFLKDDGRGVMMIEHALWGRALPAELARNIGRASVDEVYVAANNHLNGNHASVLVGPSG